LLTIFFLQPSTFHLTRNHYIPLNAAKVGRLTILHHSRPITYRHDGVLTPRTAILRGILSELCSTNTIMGTWNLNDLTAAADAPLAAPGSALYGYQTISPNQQHVNYIGIDSHVYELMYDNKWNYNDLTEETGAPLAAPRSPFDGYQSASSYQQHINFIGFDGHVHELVYTNAWSHNDPHCGDWRRHRGSEKQFGRL
jgi:hypothetical protein